MRMTIHDYIGKHGLTQRNVPRERKWTPATLRGRGATAFEVFGNDAGNHVVVLNTTKNQFEIMHGDMVFRETDWLATGRRYQTKARPFWE